MDADLLVHEAWPAWERRALGGWVLRYAGGVTKRANSVLATGPADDPDAAIAAAEAFYAERGAPCVFSVGAAAPPGLDRALDARGYALVDPTVVMAGAIRGEPSTRVRIEPRPWRGWLETWWRVDGGRAGGLEAAERILTGVPALYAAVEEGGVPVAVGRGVPQGDTLGIFCVATVPAARRRGLARAVLRALAAESGAPGAYLAVTERNAAARALYESEGLEPKGRYYYRAGPAPDAELLARATAVGDTPVEAAMNGETPGPRGDAETPPGPRGDAETPPGPRGDAETPRELRRDVETPPRPRGDGKTPRGDDGVRVVGA
ncbi:GNAT family N-acetyltransferase [Nonomuraea sp. MCN248]|uniref:GNAT family N-acetyltransferase n=1 Tax=Nonomuraea corallina TaxID=2989783 RepID=A0ABT4S689_9ACTN|nr:GNAT family N-acetyltransferase [Nonomuraea corallina]MDA0632456.1 GNAT family N-acetyltransferase [Nonomuraea corallina]